MANSRIFVSELEKLPKDGHFAILEQDRYSREDYGETSWNPFLGYIAYLNKEDLIKELTERASKPSYMAKSYKVVQVIPLTINVNVSVGLDCGTNSTGPK